MSTITHHIPVTTGQAHHMTLRLHLSYGVPAPIADYEIYGNILQDGETVPIAVTFSDLADIQLTIPPLIPGEHSYTLHIKHKSSGKDHLILQGNCNVSELIDENPLDRENREQITATLHADLSDITTTIQLAPDPTAATLEAIAAAAETITEIRTQIEEAETAVASIEKSASSAETAIQNARTAAVNQITVSRSTACTEIQTAAETGKTNSLVAIDSAKSGALSGISSAKTAAIADISTTETSALSAIAQAVATAKAELSLSIESILSNPSIQQQFRSALGIPDIETAIAAKADTSALNNYIPYAKLGRALTKASDGKVDVDLSNYTGATVNIIGTTSACIGRSSSERLEVTSAAARILHPQKSEIVSDKCYVSARPSGYLLDSNYSDPTHAYIMGNAYGVEIWGNQEIGIRSYAGNKPGFFITGRESRTKICKWSTTSYNDLASFGDNSASISYYTTFYGGHN